MADRHPTNVMFITSDLDRGGLELRILDLAAHCPADFKLLACVTSPNVSLLDRFERCGVGVEIVPIKRAYAEVAQIRRVLRSVEQKNVEIVNTFDLKGLLVAIRIKYGSGRPLKVVHHVVNLLHDFGPRRRLALRLLLAGSDGVISNSRAARDVLAGLRFSEQRVEVIPNGVDAATFSRAVSAPSALRTALGFPDDARVIGTVANFRKEKEYPFLLGAFSRLSAAFPTSRLLCVGGGPLLDEMRQRSALLGIAEKTVFTGYVPNVPDYLSLMDVFVLTSSKEGFPNAILQAMSMEVPVVASAVGGCLEIIDPEADGLVFTPGDPGGLVEMVSRLLSDISFASTIARRARRKVQTTFGQTAMIDHYFDYFRRLSAAECAERAPRQL